MEQNNEKDKINKGFAISFNFTPGNIQTKMQTKHISPQEAIGLLEMAKDQILDNIRKGRKEMFKSFHNPNKKDFK